MKEDTKMDIKHMKRSSISLAYKLKSGYHFAPTMAKIKNQYQILVKIWTKENSLTLIMSAA